MQFTSLKGAIPHLSENLGVPHGAIYERQRALMRAGLLHARPGRGPGSGVPAGAKSMAKLLIALLATGSSLSEIAERTLAFSKLKSRDARCPVTGKKTFGDALTATLQSDELRRRAVYADAAICGASARAFIVFTEGPIDERASFNPEDATRSAFGADLVDLFEEGSGLTVATTLSLWRTLRGVEFAASKT